MVAEPFCSAELRLSAEFAGIRSCNKLMERVIGGRVSSQETAQPLTLRHGVKKCDDACFVCAENGFILCITIGIDFFERD